MSWSAVIWSPEGRADLRAIVQEVAIEILRCIDRYLADRSGDVKKLKPPRTVFRLRPRGLPVARRLRMSVNAKGRSLDGAPLDHFLLPLPYCTSLTLPFMNVTFTSLYT